MLVHPPPQRAGPAGPPSTEALPHLFIHLFILQSTKSEDFLSVLFTVVNKHIHIVNTSSIFIRFLINQLSVSVGFDIEVFLQM